MRRGVREGPRAGDGKEEPDGAPGRFLERAVGAPVEGTTVTFRSNVYRRPISIQPRSNRNRQDACIKPGFRWGRRYKPGHCTLDAQPVSRENLAPTRDDSPH